MAENELEEEGSKKKSSKLIIMIVVAVILFLAGGGASFYFLSGDSAETETEQVEGDPEAEAISEAVYYDLGKSLIVNFPKGSGASLIQISVTLLVEDEENVDALKKHEPMIRNNLLMVISAKGSANLMTREGKEALRAEMLTEIGSVMEKMTGQNKVKDIFFTTFVMQ